MLQSRRGHPAAAQACFRRALEIHRKVQADSPHATEALYHLAAASEESGDLLGAVTEFEKMLALRERQIGANPMETAAAQSRLAALHLRTGRISSARELAMRAMPMLERKGGLILAQALETLAGAEERLGRADQAQRYRAKAHIEAALHAAEARQ